ncbi:MAG: FmtA-like protein [Chloroflexi bacterium]|nr:FmtA-like protein [Chloroflexota bacterium]
MKNTLTSKPYFRVIILLLLISQVVLTGFVSAQGPISSTPIVSKATRTQESDLNSSDLEAFTDSVIEKQLEDYHIAGAIVSIVRDAQIEVAKGYGFANVERQIPVSPAETLFRIGSISKLFTWTAVMQLVERGKIDLNADVNTYLTDFQIPATFPKPITMLNLMSHSAGFEERATGIEAPAPEQMISLHDCLARYMPDRVRPAGELISYSNYGAALAGYIVEAVSGVPFEQYIEKNIFTPLSMTHSSFWQPLHPDLNGHLANSYSYKGGFVPGSFSYVNLRPAGAMTSTANDMANFMIAHIQEGRFENNQILRPETALQMHTRLFSNDDRLDGNAYGFFEETVNSRRVLWHGGDIGNWHSMLAIIPEENLGFFVSYSSIEGIKAVPEFYYALLNALYPDQEAIDPTSAQSSNADVIDIAGEYRSTRSVYNHIERILSFPGNGNFRIAVNPDRTLSILRQTFYETEPLVYASQDGTDTLVFHQAASGDSTHMQFNSIPLFAYERISWYETSRFNLLIFSACYMLLLTVILAAFIGIFKRRKGVKGESGLPGIARIWAFIISVVFLLVPAAIGIYAILDFKFAFPFYMITTLAIIFAACVMVVGPVIFTILAWVRRFWDFPGRLHYTLITIAMLDMVWLMYYWRLLGFRY